MNTDLNELNWDWEELEETDSTNRVAMERVLARWGRGAQAEGLVIVARRQTAGRGQHGRVWESPEGGLYLSAVLEDVPIELRERLALAAGVCVVGALEGLGAKELLIRWPNDVVVDQDGVLKKLGGILCEAVALGDKWAVVIGIGINIARAALPRALPAMALADIGLRLAPRPVAAAITRQLAGLSGAKLAEIVAQVRQRDALHGRHVRVQQEMQVWDGTAAGIDDTGRLLLATAQGLCRIERGSLHGGGLS